MGARGKFVVWRRPLSLLVAAAFVADPAAAQVPTGGAVTAGSATISQPSAGRQVVDQASTRAIIDWQSFSIGAGNSVIFRQPGASSIALNRVVGTDASSILGSLSANGQIFLVNPNGVYFGRGATVDTAGFVGSTLDIRNEDFLAGRYVFARREGAPAAAVTNEGILRAAPGGYVVLAGDRVANRYEGLVEARLGTAALVAGSRVTLDIAGDQLVNLSVDAPTADRLGGAKNAGTLAADGGRVVMSAMAARDVAGAVVNNTGLVRATGIDKRNGVIELTANAGGIEAGGTLDASGASGGAVRLDGGTGTTIVSGRIAASGSAGAGGAVAVLGDRVGVFSGASIDASGSNGGGTLLVGGDTHGDNPDVRNSQRTYVAASAALRADATESGDGGKIVVWSDGSTRFDGSASARGGAAAGNGGFVEVSGKQSLLMDGNVDTRAPNGGSGSLLLDPSTLTITDGAAASGSLDGQLVPPGTDGSLLAADADSGGNTISRGQLEAFNATTDITLEATGQITVNNMAGDLINLATGGGHTFKLRSTTSGGINFLDANDEIRTSGGNIQLIAEGTGTIGTLGKLTSNGGNIVVESADHAAAGTVGLAVNSAINAGTGSVVLETREASTGTQTMVLNAAITGSSVYLRAADGISQTGGGIAATNLSVRFANGASGDTVSLTGANNVTNLAAKVEGSGTTGNSFSFSNAAGNPLTITSISDPNTSFAPDLGGNPPFAAATATGIASGLGSVTLVADSIAVNQAINAGPTSGGGAVVIRAATASRAMTLGANTGGTLALDQAELNQISGSLLRIGDAAATGTITLSGTVSAPSTWNTLSLKTTSGVTQTSGTLVVPNVAVEAAGNISLTNTSTSIGSFAATSTGGSVTYNYGSASAGGLTIGAPGGIDGVNGVTGTNVTIAAGGQVTLNQDISANTTTGTVTISSGSAGASETGGKITAANLLAQGAGAFDFSSGANSIGTLAAAVNGSFSYRNSGTGLLTIGTVGTTSGIVTAGNAVTLAADRMDIASGILTAGGGVTLKTDTAANAIDVGSASDGTANTLEISTAEISRIIAGSGSLTIGSAAQAGGIKVSAPVSTPLISGGITLDTSAGGDVALNAAVSSGPGGTGAVTLKALGSVSDAGAGGTGGVAGSFLNVQAGTGISLTGSANAVSTFAASNSTSGAITLVDNKSALSVQGVSQGAAADISISNTGSLTVSTQAVTTPAGGGNIGLSAGGAMTLAQSVIAGGGGDVTLSAGGGLTQTAGVIGADQLLLTGSGAFSLTSTTTSTAAGVTTTTYNNANTLAANIAGSLDYREEDALTVGTIGATNGITTNGNLTIVSGGQKTAGPGPATSATGGTLTLAQSLSAGSGVITLTANKPTAGSADVNQTGGAITGSALLVTAGGAATLAQAGNDVTTLAIGASGAVSYRDTGGFTVGSTGISSNGGNVALAAGGAVALTTNVNAGAGNLDFSTTSGGYNQTAGAITGNTLRVTGAGPFSLAQTGNNVVTLAANVTGNFTYTDANALTIGTVGGTSGVQSTDKGAISITAQNGTLTVDQPVLSGPALVEGAPLTPNDRGAVGLTAFGFTSDLLLNADVTAGQLRLFADRFITQKAAVGVPPASQLPLLEASSLLEGSQNNPTLRFNGPAPTLDELVYNFSGPTTVNQDLVANRVILRSQQDGSSFTFGAGHKVTATDLLLMGDATFNLNNAGNETTVLAAGSSSGGGSAISYTDSNSFSVGIYPSSFPFLGLVNGIGNSQSFFGLFSVGVKATNVSLAASGTGGVLTLSQPLTASGTVALSAQAGVTQTAGGAISASALALTGGGTFSLASANNDVATLSGSLTNLGSLSYFDANDVAIGTAGGFTGLSASGPGALSVNISSNGNLAVSSPVSVTTTSTAAPALLALSADQDINISQNITVSGGSVSTGNGALAQIWSARGGVFQTGGGISVTDNGPATVSSQAPHQALVDVRAGKQSQDSGQAISGCGRFILGLPIDGGTSGCGQVSLNGVGATSTNGRAIVQVRGPASITTTGALTATSATAPLVGLSADIQNSNGDVVSQGDMNVAGAVTVQQTAASDQNDTNKAPAGVVVSGRNLTFGTVASNSIYGISIGAANNITMNGNMSTTATGGVSLSTLADAGTIKTTGSARITAKQLGIVGDRDKGIFNVKTDIETVQILGGRAATIDNGAHTGTLTATVLGRISDATTDPATGTSVPATDKPIGALSLTTGGELIVFALNNFAKDPSTGSGNIFDLNGNGASRQPLILKANSITPTPGAFITAPWTDVTLLPFTAGRTVEVRNLPSASPDPNTTYYLGNVVGLLNQFNPEANLIIGGPTYTGNIFVGSQTSPGNFPLSEQFSLGKMRVTFQTTGTGRVFNRFASNQDAPTNWQDSFLVSPPFAPTPAFLCTPGVACLTNITGGRAEADVIIIDSLSNGNTTRNVALSGTGTGLGGTLPPAGSTSGGGSSGSGGSGGGGGSSGSNSSSGGSGNSSSGEPGGGGTSGTPGGVTTTVVTTPPSDSPPTDSPTAPGGETSGGDSTAFNSGGTPGPDGGTSSGLAGTTTDDTGDGTGTTLTDGSTPGGGGPDTTFTDSNGTGDGPGTTLTDGTGTDGTGTTLTDNGTGTDGTGTTLTDSGGPDGGPGSGTNGNGTGLDGTNGNTLAGGGSDTSGSGFSGDGTGDSSGNGLSGGGTDGTGLAGDGTGGTGTTLAGDGTGGSGDSSGSGLSGGGTGTAGDQSGGTGGTGSGFADGTGNGPEGGTGGTTLADGSGDSNGNGLSGDGAGGTGDSSGNGLSGGGSDGNGLAGDQGGGEGTGFARGNGEGTEGTGGTGTGLAGEGTDGGAATRFAEGSGDSGSRAASSGLTGDTDAGGSGQRGDQIAFAGGASGDAASADASRAGGEGGSASAQANAPRATSLEAQDCVADSQSTRNISRVGTDAVVAARGDGIQLDRDSRGCAGAGAGAVQRNQ